MNINLKDIITLSDDREYVVTSKINYEGNDYIYIVDIHDTANIKFAEIQKEGDQAYISEIKGNEKELLEKLIPLFFDTCKSIFNESPEA